MKKNILITVFCLFTFICAKAYDFEVGGIYYNINSMESMLVEVVSGEKKYIGSITIPETVSYREKEFKVVGIGDNAFYGCNITGISIPNGVRYVDNGSFQNCRNLKSVILPESLLGIGVCAFKNSGLTEIVIPDKVTDILDSAFVNCSSLKSVTIGKSVEFNALPPTTFVGCSNVNELIMGDSKESLEIQCIYRFGQIKNNTTFGYFTKLRRLYVGRNLVNRTGNNHIFPDDMQIEHLELGRFVQYFTFGNIDFKTITVYRKVPLVIESYHAQHQDFTIKTKMDAILYVPEGYVDLYKEAEFWKEFWTIKEMVE